MQFPKSAIPVQYSKSHFNFLRINNLYHLYDPRLDYWGELCTDADKCAARERLLELRGFRILKSADLLTVDMQKEEHRYPLVAGALAGAVEISITCETSRHLLGY